MITVTTSNVLTLWQELELKDYITEEPYLITEWNEDVKHFVASCVENVVFDLDLFEGLEPETRLSLGGLPKRTPNGYVLLSSHGRSISTLSDDEVSDLDLPDWLIREQRGGNSPYQRYRRIRSRKAETKFEVEELAKAMEMAIDGSNRWTLIGLSTLAFAWIVHVMMVVAR